MALKFSLDTITFLSKVLFHPAIFRDQLSYVQDETIDENVLRQVIIDGLFALLEYQSTVENLIYGLDSLSTSDKNCKALLTLLTNQQIGSFLKEIIANNQLIKEITNTNFQILKSAQDVIRYIKSNPKQLKALTVNPDIASVQLIVEKFIEHGNFKDLDDLTKQLLTESMLKQIATKYYTYNYYSDKFLLYDESYLTNPNKTPVAVLFDSRTEIINNVIKWLVSQVDFAKLKATIKELVNQKREQLTKKITTINFINSEKITTKVGDQIPIEPGILYSTEHSNKFVPIIYVNGNVIEDEVTITNSLNDNSLRKTHHELLLHYYHNQSLHKNDIDEYDEAYWNSIQSGSSDDSYWDRQTLRAVKNTIQNTIIIMCASPEIYQRGLNKLKEEYPGVPVFDVTDNGKFLEQIAARRRKNKINK